MGATKRRNAGKCTLSVNLFGSELIKIKFTMTETNIIARIPAPVVQQNIL